jgi:hypothetical protein
MRSRAALLLALASCATPSPPTPEPPEASGDQVPEGFVLIPSDPPLFDDRSSLSGRVDYIHWEKYFSEHETARALIVAVHPEGSNIGELEDITRRLLAEGFDVLLIDLSHGGAGWGRTNMTAATREGEYDVIAEIDFVVDGARYKSLNRPVQWVPAILLIHGIAPEQLEDLGYWLTAIIDVSQGPDHTNVGNIPIVREPLHRGDPERGIPATFDEDGWARIFTQLEAEGL